MRLLTFATGDEAAAEAADEIARSISGAVRDRGRCCLAFSGGSTPRRMLEELAKAELPWQSIHVFQVDERLARDDSTDRNFTGLRDHLLSHVALPAGNLHPMPVGMASIHDAADRYEDILRAVCGDPPRLDVVHLGLGPDGHVASLFPDSPELDIEDRAVTATGEHAGFRRITMTLPILNAAGHLVVLATGDDKARAVEGLRSGRAIPAARLRREALTVFVDEAAAPPAA